MAMTEHKFDRNEIKELVAEKAAGLKRNRNLSDLLGFGVGVVNDRLKKDSRRYRDYGPYWPALKAILRERGYDWGSNSADPLVAAEYCGDTQVETLIMADEFRTQYLATQFVGSNRFVLDSDTGEFWELYDQDMEAAHEPKRKI